MESTEFPQSGSTWQRPLAYGVLGFYWVGLFVLTHIPRLPPPPELLQSDKIHHFLAYGLLTLLFMIARATKVQLQWTDYLKAFFLLSLYGAADELSQIPVGRSGEVLDWIADLAGISLSLACFALLRTIWQNRMKGRSSIQGVKRGASERDPA